MANPVAHPVANPVRNHAAGMALLQLTSQFRDGALPVAAGGGCCSWHRNFVTLPELAFRWLNFVTLGFRWLLGRPCCN